MTAIAGYFKVDTEKFLQTLKNHYGLNPETASVSAGERLEVRVHVARKDAPAEAQYEPCAYLRHPRVGTMWLDLNENLLPLSTLSDSEMEKLSQLISYSRTLRNTAQIGQTATSSNGVQQSEKPNGKSLESYRDLPRRYYEQGVLESCMDGKAKIKSGNRERSFRITKDTLGHQHARPGSKVAVAYYIGEQPNDFVAVLFNPAGT